MRKTVHTLRDSPSVAVDRALDILDLVAASTAGLSNSDLSRRLAIPKSSASYILRVLERRGLLLRDRESGKYRLGLKLLSLAHAVEAGADLRRASLPAMRHLVQRIHLTAHLAILDRGEAVYIEKVEAPSFIRMDTWVGRRMQVNSTSVGKALVARLPEEELDAVLRQHGLKRRTLIRSRSGRGSCASWNRRAAEAMRWTTRKTAWERAVWRYRCWIRWETCGRHWG